MTDFNPELTFDETAFMSFGACVSDNPRYFDTSTRDGVTTLSGSVRIGGHKISRVHAVAHAKKVCSTCPVLSECLDYITRYPSDTSIWAGLLPEERNSVANGI
jgi:hypothetical protein